MNLARRILGVIVALLVLLLCTYLSFPWWGKSLIESKLPSGWRLDAIAIEYPNWQSLSITSMSLTSNELRVSIENLSLNLSDESVALASLTATQIVDNTGQLKPLSQLSLPRIQPDFFLATLPFQSLSIEQLSWQSTADTYRGNQLKFNILSNQRAQLAMQLLPNNMFAHEQNILFDIQFAREQLRANLLLNEQETCAIHWQFAADSQALTLTADLEALEKTFPNLVNLPQLNFQGSAELQIRQQATTQALSLHGRVTGSVRDARLPGEPIQFSLSSEVAAIPQTIEWPLQMTSRARLWPANNNLHLGESQIIAPTLMLESSLQLAPQGVIVDQLTGQFGFEQALIQQGASQYQVGPMTVDLAMPVKNNEIFSLQRSELDLIFHAVPVSLREAQAEAAPSLSGLLHGHLKLRNMLDPEMDGALVAEQIHIGELYQSSNSPVSLEVSNLRADLGAGEIRARLLDQNALIAGVSFAQLESNLSANLSNGTINGTGTIDLNQEPLTKFQISADLDTGASTLTFPPAAFSQSAINHLLASTTSELSNQIELVTGKMTHQANLSLSPAPALANQIELSDATIRIDDHQLTGVSANLSSAIDDGLVHQLAVSADQLTASSGNIISDIKATARYQSPDNLQVDSLSFNIFDGQFFSDSIALINGELMASSFAIDNVSLQAFFDALQIQDLVIEGRGNIVGKIRTEQGNLIVEKFEIQNIAPGILKYTDFESLGLSDNLATQALENFHYSELEGQALNATKLSIPLKIRILGSNPELNIDRPFEITFNLNATVEGAELLELLLGTVL